MKKNATPANTAPAKQESSAADATEQGSAPEINESAADVPTNLVSEETHMHTGLAANYAVLQTRVDSLTAIVEGIKSGTALNVNDKPAVPTIPKDLVESNGKQYRWVVPHFVLPVRGRMTAEEASLEPKVIEEILAIEGQGILVEQH